MLERQHEKWEQKEKLLFYPFHFIHLTQLLHDVFQILLVIDEVSWKLVIALTFVLLRDLLPLIYGDYRSFKANA